MSAKTDTEVIIGGKVFTLSGYESEEYLQKVASYINNKVNEYGKADAFRRLPLDTQNVLLQLNIADDYFKAKQQITLLEEELKNKEKELYDLKHELIASQIKLEKTEKNVKNLQLASPDRLFSSPPTFAAPQWLVSPPLGTVHRLFSLSPVSFPILPYVPSPLSVWKMEDSLLLA